jgi:hypothetical protein
LWPGEQVFIEEARLGVKQQVLTGVCLAHLGEVNGEAWYLACAAEEGPTVVESYRKRVWIEEQNRDQQERRLPDSPLPSGHGGAD